MKMISTNCPSCGATLKVDSEMRSVICEHCGSSFMIDDEVQHIQYDNAAETGYQFEKGRQRAQAEARMQANQTNVASKGVQKQPAKKKKTWLWVLGWICIFPLPLTILLLRKKDMKPALKYGVIAAAWIIYFIIGGSDGSGDSNKSIQPEETISTVAETSSLEGYSSQKMETSTVEEEESTKEASDTVDEISLLQAFYDDFSAGGALDNLRDMVAKYGLYTDHRKDGIGHDTYKVACTKDLAKVISNSDFATEGNYVVIKFNLLQDDNVDSITFHIDADDKKIEGEHYDESLNGRGRADSGREEPQYVDVIGYVAISSSQAYDVEKNEDFQNENLWMVPTYEQDKQFWNEVGALPHKTEVVVREQMLEHEGYGAYSGYLLVEKIDDGSQYYINVKNFITKPYWTYQSELRIAALTGIFVAEYNQTSDYYPVSRSNEKVELDNGTVVLVKGITGTYGKNGPDDDTNQIEAIVWKEWKLGYGGVSVYFNMDDLTIKY